MLCHWPPTLLISRLSASLTLGTVPGGFNAAFCFAAAAGRFFFFFGPLLVGGCDCLSATVGCAGAAASAADGTGSGVSVAAQAFSAVVDSTNPLVLKISSLLLEALHNVVNLHWHGVGRVL